MMIPDSAKIAFIILMMTLSLSETHAQDRSLGASFSYAGSGLSYERSIDEDTFVEVQLRAETAHMFSSLTDKPGITASFTWNMIFSELTSSNGNRICFFAGPGITAGSVYDLPAQKGLVFGLKGRVGGECTFSRKIAVSASLSPVIGAHVSMKDGMPCMKIYRLGLLYTLMPEVGIRYTF